MKCYTPICDFVKEYSKRLPTRFHMPGHKGKQFIGLENRDITEIEGADVLYCPSGIIEQSQQITTDIFGTANTYFSTEGSSLCIRAMLYIALKNNTVNGNPYILACRNAHKVFVTTCALLGIDVSWLYGEENELCSTNITPQMLEGYLATATQKPIAVYVTTPDYLGNLLDVKGLASVVRKYGVPLICDNAHGAYLKFTNPSMHPIDLGADMCCDSAHKTLPCLTGGAYLHISKTAPQSFKDTALEGLSIFSSTSPSYLILQSLDNLNELITFHLAKKIADTCQTIKDYKAQITALGWQLVGSEPFKITLSTKQYGYTGVEIASILKERNIIVEYADVDYIVMMISTETTKNELAMLLDCLRGVKKKRAIKDTPPTTLPKKQSIPLNKAMFMQSESIPVKKCLGRVCATPQVSCPPAIPVVVYGEEIDKNAIEIFKYYDIKTVCVIKK